MFNLPVCDHHHHLDFFCIFFFFLYFLHFAFWVMLFYISINPATLLYWRGLAGALTTPVQFKISYLIFMHHLTSSTRLYRFIYFFYLFLHKQQSRVEMCGLSNNTE